ncbi:MAG: MATE family efflux transporter [Pseudomonadota bacterium]
MTTTDAAAPAETSYGRIIALAWPASVAAAVTPLLGAVDVWALAHSARPLDIAAVGLGSVIFSLAYWTFGFIRMSVAGLTAQADGAGDEGEVRAALIRGGAIGAGVGAALVMLQWPIGAASFHLLSLGSEASTETLAAGLTYFKIRIWGAPFALASYAAFGWLTARGRTDYLMIVSLFITGLNIVLDYWFVVGLGCGASGVALGTLIAEVSGFFVAGAFILMILHRKGGVRAHWSAGHLWRPDRLRRTLSVNRDIFIRTFLLAFCFAWFTQRGGAFGDVTLAANQVLLQLFLFTGLALDGTAIAAETLVGQALGAGDKARGRIRYRSAVRRGFILAGAAAILFMSAYLIAGDHLIAMLTPEGAIRAAAKSFMPWVVVSPLMVVIGFQLDGIFIGATRAREMRDSMIVSTIVFLPASLWLASLFGNHGLWAAFLLYFFLRGVSLWVYLPRIGKSFTD